jgi:hypothetical protein
LERIDRDKAGIETGMRAQELFDGLARHVLATRERKMGMPRPEIRLDAGGERGVSHAFVQLKKVRVSAANA